MLRNEMVGDQVAMVGQTNVEVPGGGDKEGIVSKITLLPTSEYFQIIFDSDHMVMNSQEVDTGVGIKKEKK